MKIRSQALFHYLLQQGVLHGPPEALERAKADYRRLYKRKWKQHKKLRKEIRFELTLQQFQTIQLQAKANNMRHTTYIKSLALTSIGERYTDQALLDILQLISMATIAVSHTISAERAYQLLLKAETRLTEYVKPSNAKQ